MEAFEEKFIYQNKDERQKSIINIILPFIIFLTVTAFVLSLHIINIKKEDNAKKIISESIVWFADIQNTANYLLNTKNTEELLNVSNLNNYIPIANISFENSQKSLNVNDLTAYLQASMANQLYFIGNDAFTDSNIELSYRENKNRYLIYNFYDLVSKKSLEAFHFINQVAIFIFVMISIFLIWINSNKAFFLIGASICFAAFPILASAISIKIGMNIFFSSNDITEFYQNYVNQFALHVQVSSVTIFVIGLIVIGIGWLMNNLLVNNQLTGD